MSVIETSKLLLECAEFHERHAGYLIGSKDWEFQKHYQYAEALRSIAIPEPVKEDDPPK